MRPLAHTTASLLLAMHTQLFHFGTTQRVLRQQHALETCMQNCLVDVLQQGSYCFLSTPGQSA